VETSTGPVPFFHRKFTMASPGPKAGVALRLPYLRIMPDRINSTLVALAISHARNSERMLGEPLPHLWIGPGPLEGMGI
jgi:hypothetical protein